MLSMDMRLAKRPRAIAFLAPSTLSPRLRQAAACTTMQPTSVLLPRRPPMMHAFAKRPDGSSEADDEDDDANDAEMRVYKRNGSQRHGNGHLLPFDVSVISPPHALFLGRFRLDPHTHCGDIVEHDGRHFIVQVVRMQYKWLRGKYRVFSKAIEVTSLARRSVETYLERSLRES